jgi:hypothetical protein
MPLAVIGPDASVPHGDPKLEKSIETTSATAGEGVGNAIAIKINRLQNFGIVELQK